MFGSDLRGQFLFNLPSSVLWEFCRVMDGLSDLDWTRFASEVLKDQTAVRLAERKERRTDWVMNQWGSRNGRVGELIDLLESLQLFRPRDVILDLTQKRNPPPPLPPPPPLNEQSVAPPTANYSGGQRGAGLLPGPAPPPVSLYSEEHQGEQERQREVTDEDAVPLTLLAASHAVICWAYEEVHAGTQGFSTALQVGEGGFGVVYRASLRNMDCAVKKLRQDCLMDWSQLRRSFQTEVEKLSKFRHPNIVDLLGFSEGGGQMCLIYSYMENRSLEDQLHTECLVLSWPHRIRIVEGAAAALQYLHCPPKGQEPLIHGDVKSSNILLDQHWVAKLSDFGLARYGPHSSSGCSTTQTASVARTTTVRGTLAYLPDEYVRRGELCTAVDVYSFGVVLLEVLTGRRALDQDQKSRDRYLKDLVQEVDDGPNCLAVEGWKKHLDRRLIAGSAEPDGYLQVAALARRSLNKQRKKRPAMTEVFHELRDLESIVRRASSSPSLQQFQTPYQSFPRPPQSLDSCVGSVSNLEPLKHSCSPLRSSPLYSLTPPHPLHSSSLPHPSSCLGGPCETDESRGFSQYKLNSQFGSSDTSCRSRNRSPVGPSGFQCSQPSVPTEDQYSFSPQPRISPDSTGPRALEAGFSPAGSLQSTEPGPSVLVNPSKQRLLKKKTQYEAGLIRTPELLSLRHLDGEMSSENRGPEESDELDYLQSKTT